MQDMRERLIGFVRSLPVAHRVLMICAVAGLAMVAVLFMRWVTTPSYTVLYSGLDDKAVAGVIDELEAAGIPYQLQGGGSRILVPREQLYTTRASLAQAGVAAETTPPGYELLDKQGLSVSDFRQRVDYQRALEGELAKTLMAMDGVNDATVHLVIPEEELFAERQKPVTASVLLDTTRPLEVTEVETVTFLVASSVEGLEVSNVTVADAKGQVLHAPGDAGSSGMSNRNLRQTRDFELALADDITRLLERVTGSQPSVVVRASLNYDEREEQTETFGPKQGVTVKEQTTGENYQGRGAPPGGTVGVDGGPQPTQDGDTTDYQRDEAIREFGVDKVTARTVAAPGALERLSVAIVMDDGSVTGVPVPQNAEIERLVTAALGLDAERGDEIAVSTIPYPAADEEADAQKTPALLDLLPQIVAAIVLLLIALALFLMTRRRRKDLQEPEPVEQDEEIVVGLPVEPALEALEGAQGRRDPLPELPPNRLQEDVSALVERQPEEIAMLLRGWLADRRVER
jgi:flagellar M-ring protein FliF